MENSGQKRNQEFTERIRKRHEIQQAAFYWENLTYFVQKKADSQVHVQKNLSQLISNSFQQKIRQYEEMYYRLVTNQDNRRFLHIMEGIYNQPGEKKQLVHLLRKFGVVTQEQKEWKENMQRLKQYEEELSILRKQIRQQEEYFIRQKKAETKPQLVSDITKEVVRSIKQEIRLERLRCGTD